MVPRDLLHRIEKAFAERQFLSVSTPLIVVVALLHSQVVMFRMPTLGGPAQLRG